MKDFNKALNYSFLLLKYRARSRAEIASRLKKKGYSASIIEKTIAYLKEANCINDEDFVENFVNYSLEKGWGPRRIDFNLNKLGISCELRKQVLERQIDYRPKIREIIKRKLTYYKKSGDRDKGIWQKISRSLVAKGFSYEDIFREMKDMEVDRLANK